MYRIQMNGSPRTAARQLVELLTRDGVFDEDGNVRPDEVEAACRYVKSPAATDGSSPSNKSEIPDAKSEPCSEDAESESDDTSHTHTPDTPRP